MNKAELKEMWQLAQRLVEHVQRGNQGVWCYRFIAQDRVLQMEFTTGTILTATPIVERPIFNTLYERYPTQRWTVYSETLSLHRSRAEFELMIRANPDSRPVEHLPNWAKYFILREERALIPDDRQKENSPENERGDKAGDGAEPPAESNATGNRNYLRIVPPVVQEEQSFAPNSDTGTIVAGDGG